jgi:hypothetical protein
VADPGGREPDDLPPPRPKKGGGGPAFGVLSLVLGVSSLALCCCPPLPLALGGGAIVTGLIGLRNRDGRGFAGTGLVLGVIALGWTAVSYAIGLSGPRWPTELFD